MSKRMWISVVCCSDLNGYSGTFLLNPTTVGFSKNVPEYPFPIWDPDRIIVQDVRNVSAPPDCPKPGEGHDEIGSAPAGVGCRTRVPEDRNATRVVQRK